MGKPVRTPVAPSVPATFRTAPGASAAAKATRRGPLGGRECGTCGATFATEDALWAHLIDAYHGFQCLRCGALYARRGDHACPGRSRVPG